MSDYERLIAALETMERLYRSNDALKAELDTLRAIVYGLQDTGAKCTYSECVSNGAEQQYSVRLHFRQLSDAHEYLNALVELGSHYKERMKHETATLGRTTVPAG